MRFRGKSIRRKIVALLLVPLVSLTALWGFATVLTGREAVQLLDVAYVIGKVGYPIEDVVRVIQKERRQTLVLLGNPTAIAASTELAKSRTATDKMVGEITANARDPEVVEELNPEAAQRLRSILDAFHGIAALRHSVDNNSVDPTQALDLYSRLIDPCYEFLMNLHALEDVEMDKQGRALVGITRARESLSRADGVIASALAAGNVSAANIRTVSDLAANRRLLYEFNLDILPADDRGRFEQFWSGPETKALRDAEERFITGGAGKNQRAVTAAQWDEAAGKVLTALADMGTAAGDRYQKRVEPLAMGVMIQAAVAGVLGFIALAVSLLLSVRIGRDLIRDLSRLRKEAHEASGVRLPSVMRRLAAGESVDVETEAPHLEFEKDEVGQVGQALNSLQRAAVEAAVKQAELRRGVSEVFVNLARRNQVLLHRQLTLLDTMERRTEDTEELADLFRLDHMTTRMRRHAEGLVILSGAAPSRQWRKPVQLMDVVRAAVAEVEDYERIEVRRLARIGIEGPAVADVTHLVAELLENATVFSPPHTAVQVHGERVANGFTLEIHDRGLGMNPEALLDANLRLAETPDFELSDTDRLGLFVVSRLARRHGIRVVLQPSPYGGTTAVVFLPVELLTDAPDTNGTGLRLDTIKGAKNLKGAPAGKRPERRPAGAPGAASARPLPAGVLNGPVELEGPSASSAWRASTASTRWRTPTPRPGPPEASRASPASAVARPWPASTTRPRPAASRAAPCSACARATVPTPTVTPSAAPGRATATPSATATPTGTARASARAAPPRRPRAGAAGPTGPVRAERSRPDSVRPDGPTPAEPSRCPGAAPPRPWSPSTAAASSRAPPRPGPGAAPAGRVAGPRRPAPPGPPGQSGAPAPQRPGRDRGRNPRRTGHRPRRGGRTYAYVRPPARLDGGP
ncbi:nitrate- and nitrite sensing domain-containing protein [Streptomyces sp. RerS4]|uniref:sensor histidine kinase n=1 Tax=Streptomyces sp. RerS4 TaxID=2942449 RepID=UPI0032E3673F